VSDPIDIAREKASKVMSDRQFRELYSWKPIETAPRDGREILCCISGTDMVRVCYPKEFPRPITEGDDMTQSRPGDVWEFFRDDENARGFSWSMAPTHWMPLPEPPATDDKGNG
jgi:hypothetical protein